FFSSRRRHTRLQGDWSSDVCSSDLRTPIAWYLVVSALLFTIGTVGVLVRRNALVIFMSVELQLNAANLALVAFARRWGSVTGQRSEERRVGKECRSRWSADREEKWR